MIKIPEVLKGGLSADTVYPTDSYKTIIKKLENNRYIISMLEGSKSLSEVYMDAKKKESEKKNKEPAKEEKIIHKIF